MSKLATFLRMRNREIAENLSAEERVELAFKLGEADLESFRATHGLTRAAALAHFRRQRQRGRHPCRCMLEVERALQEAPPSLRTIWSKVAH